MLSNGNFVGVTTLSTFMYEDPEAREDDENKKWFGCGIGSVDELREGAGVRTG